MENTILLFCANCTIEIIPMLLVAWLFGFIFWWMFKGIPLSNQVRELTSSEALLKKKTTDLQLDLDTKGYELNKLKATYTETKNKFDTLELKYRAVEEQLKNKGD